MPTASNPTLTPSGSVAWANDVNNWRANDAHWLQSRSILRFIGISAVSDRTAALAALPGSFSSEGTISYVGVGASRSFVARLGTAPADDVKLFASNFLGLSSDSSTTVNLKHSSGAVGLQFTHTGVSSISGLSSSQNFRIGPATFTDTVVNIADTGGATVSLSKDVAGAAPGYLRVTGNFTVTADTKLAGKLDVTGLSTLPTLLVTGTSEFRGTVTATGTSTEVVAPTFRGALIGNATSTTVVAGNLTLNGNTVTSGTSYVGVSGTSGVTLKTVSPIRTVVNDGSQFPAPVASVIVQNTPPPTTEPAGDYPDGCIWVQV